jgi:hypothetical protein
MQIGRFSSNLKQTVIKTTLVLIVFFVLLGFIAPPKSVQAQGVEQGNVLNGPAVLLQIIYGGVSGDDAGIAGPEGDSPEVYDELVYPAYLVDANDQPQYITYTKVNINEDDDTISRAYAKFSRVEPGTYRACIPLEAPPVIFASDYLCSNSFTYDGSAIPDYTAPPDATIQTNTEESRRIIEAALAFRINEKPCTGSQIGWIICPIAEQLHETMKTLYNNVFKSLLVIDPLYRSADDGTAEAALFDIWNSFRFVATGLFVVLFLVALGGSGLAGWQAFSPYQMKKIWPRLVIAMVGIQLSWYITSFMVDVFNVIGAGLRGIMLAPVEGLDLVSFDTGELGGNLIFFIASGGLITTFFAVGGVIGILFLVPMIFLTVMMAIIFGVVIMLLRNALILIGIVASPIAMAFWVLPNTQNFFMFWWNTMWRLLVMYPLVIGLIALGELMSKLVVAGNENDLMASIVSLTVLFAPFFLIPYTFRVAQNVIGSVTTGLDGQRRQISQRVFGSPEDEGSYRARAAAYRNRYSTQRRFNRYHKHFIAPGKQKTIGMRRRWFPSQDKILPFKTRPGIVNSDKSVRKSWKFKERTAFDTRDLSGKDSSKLRGARRNENIFQYAASLPRFALRTPGRMYARLAANAAAFTGMPGIDESMGIRNRTAKKKVQTMEKMGARDAFAHAMFGDYNLFTGERLDNDVINAAKPHRNDDAVAQENMKWLFNKAANIPYRRQLLIDHWMGAGHPLLPDGYRYENEHLQPFLQGMMKGVSFGTQGDWRDNKHRDWLARKRMPTAAERRDLKALDEVDPAERRAQDFLVGMGQVTDGKIDGYLNEAANLMQDKQIVGFSGTYMMGFDEIAGRLEDIARVETGEINYDLVKKISKDEYDKLTPAQKAARQAELRKLKQGTAARDAVSGKWIFDNNGEIVMSHYDDRAAVDPNAKRRDRKAAERKESELSDMRVGEDVGQIAQIREAILDTMAQGDVPFDVGDDENPDALRPTQGQSSLYSRWRKNDIAEYEYIEEYKKLNSGAEPSTDDLRAWRNGTGSFAGKGRAEYLAANETKIQGLQNERIRLILDTAGNRRMSQYTYESARRFIENTDWVTDRARLTQLNKTGLMGDVDSIVSYST